MWLLEIAQEDFIPGHAVAFQMGLINSKQKRNPVLHRTSSGTRLEDLSNELFYELFDYLSYHDICYAFAHLNVRLDDLLEGFSPCVDLQQHAKNSLRPLPNDFRSLRISARHHVSLMDFSQISAIRALTLANIPSSMSLNILNTIPLERLEYVYVGASPYYQGFMQDEMALLQETILRLAQSTLKRCVLRMRFCGNVDVIPYGLSALEYLRIDGCQNTLVINQLLDRMPNLKYFRVSILEPMSTETTRDNHQKEIAINRSLTHLIIHTHGLASPDDLQSIFARHGANVRTLIIYLNSIQFSLLSTRTPVDIAFVHRRRWTATFIDQYFRYLEHFQIRQRVFSDVGDFRNHPMYFPPHREEISSSSPAATYRVSVASQLADLWRSSLWVSDSGKHSMALTDALPSSKRMNRCLNILLVD